MPATRRRSENAHEASRSPVHVISPLLTRSNQGVADAGAVESLLIRGAYAVRVFDSSQYFGLPVFRTVAASSGQRSNLSFGRGGNLAFGLVSKDASARGVRAAWPFFCVHVHIPNAQGYHHVPAGSTCALSVAPPHRADPPFRSGLVAEWAPDCGLGSSRAQSCITAGREYHG